ncbi:FxDxF family PEP-CTERM protein [Sphingomonas aliaeris]|uniref:FxDxF family PEP-CTERM protein n=1 Tax=Sphingomonas aliaeris TaxID=2759526 RepID=UPI001CEC0C25|nr:FxDxF family PEP-CTERM protein [Sphingomonas aliaeris]
MKKFNSLLAATLLSATAFGAAPAMASVVFDNQVGSNVAGGNNPQALDNWVAQDFVLSEATALTSFTFNAFTRQTTVPTSAIRLNIYEGGNSGPGAMLYSGSFGVASTADTDMQWGYTLRDFTADLPNWNLGAGAYYLALNVQPSQYDMHWSIPNTPTLDGNSWISTTGAAGSFNGYSFDHSFQLNGNVAAVPEPATWAMMIAGFGMVGFAMRRRAKVSTAVAYA